MKLYDKDFVELLDSLQRKSSEESSLDSRHGPVVVFGSRIRYLDELGCTSSSSSESENEDKKQKTNKQLNVEKNGVNAEVDVPKIRKGKGKYGLSCIYIPFKLKSDNLQQGDDSFVCVPTALLQSNNTDLRSYNLSTYLKDIAIKSINEPIVILLIRSGRFAGGVFLKDKCVEHRACQRYTVRRGQGGSQKNNDNSKGKAKSIGAQLRRAGEIALQEDIKETLQNWSKLINESILIFLSCPNVMKKDFFDVCAQARISINKADSRIRHVPVDTKRPTFDAVCQIHHILTSFIITNDPETTESVDCSKTNEDGVDSIDMNSCFSRDDSHRKDSIKPENLQKPENTLMPTELHLAAQASDLSRILELLKMDGDDIDSRAGPFEWTPLHYAAASTERDAVECVKALLITGHANPCIVDNHNRPPVFVSSTARVKDSFRLARAELGEDYTDWNEGAKVGPTLTEDMLKTKREKALEKKRRQKERQKKQKQLEKSSKEQAERHQLEVQEKLEREEETKRTSIGLNRKLKPSSCDFCTKECKRSQMFTKLTFKYCSAECVKNHQRVLIADAASRRNQGLKNARRKYHFRSTMELSFMRY